ncbi:MAG: branched-chain amino acid ABC transporter permease [Peptococcaceae bacterium]|jgi:branched-chain amino acid transport system permease protein|nr:branched-chain amino acid ABC transporter permease [Peptococcaceae bacterium]MDH7523964.1 branched-chain amino acid ABC transporter permease [Peptococcaceae bacterium]
MEQFYTFLQQVINGVSLGSIYALIALGYTMVYGIIKLINFAHGDIYMAGAYVGFFAITIFDMGFFPALLSSMFFCSVLGVIIERFAYKPLRNSTRIAALITAIGVSLFLEYGGMLIVTPQPRAFPNVFPQTKINFWAGNVYITNQQIVILAVTVLLMIILQYIVFRTQVGKAMRAVSFDKEAAQLMGINVDTTISATFAIGSALAGAAGVLVGIYYTSITPLMGIIPGLKAFVAAVLGGIGSIPGAAVGGLLMGIIEAMVSGYWSSTLRDAVAFGILILILIIKPSGIFGSNIREKV